MMRHMPNKATASKLRIYTTADLESPRYTDSGEVQNSIEVVALPNSPSIRGDNNITYVCEEFAHFNQSDKSTKDAPLDQTIYDAISPSVAGFKWPSLEHQIKLYQEDNRYPKPNAERANRTYG